MCKINCTGGREEKREIVKWLYFADSEIKSILPCKLECPLGLRLHKCASEKVNRKDEIISGFVTQLYLAWQLQSQ